MKKTILTLAILIMVGLNATAQSIDYNKIILPEGISDISYEEKLVQVAWNNHPANDEVKKSVALAKYDLKIGKIDWLDGFKMTGNLNEFNIDPSRDIIGRSIFFPRYNFSVSFPLGQLFTDPMVTKQNHIKVEMAESRVNNVKIQLRKEVLSAYNNYLMFEEIYKIQSIALEDTEMNHSIIEEGFKQGEETYEKFSASNNQISQRKISRLQSFNDLKNAKLVLESLIGVPLEDVI